MRLADLATDLLDLVLATRWEDLPSAAVDAATVFFLDTVGVACAGRMAR